MKKTTLIFSLSLILITALMFSCGGGGGGGGVDNAMKELFTISYNANGAESGIVPAAQQGDEDSPQSVQSNTGNLAKSGYLFDGWNTAANGSGTDYAPGASYKGKDVTLYAKWAAIFNVQVLAPASPAPALDGAQRAPGLSYLKILGLTARGRTLSNIVIPEAIDGYQVASIGAGAFQGCSTVTDFSIPETVIAIEDNAFAGCTGITSLTIPRSVTSIGSETFSGCGGLNNLILLNPTPPDMGANAMAGCTAVVSVPLSGVDAYKAKEGWDAYSSQIVGYGTETYTVFFDGQSATTSANPVSKAVVPPAVTVGQLPISPTKTGYNFGGWFTEPEGAGTEFTASTIVSSNITVYAKWDEYSYTVRFNDQGATTPVGESSKTVASPNTTVGTLPTEPAYSGFYFGGWNTKSDGTGTYFDANTPVTGDITVYAIWMANPTFTVTFDSEGATNYATKQIQVVSPNTTTGELPTDPVRNGFTFKGWYKGREGTGEKFTASTIVTGNITVYASWTALIRYEVNGLNATITGLTTEGRALSQIQIPETIDTYTVTAIGSYAFEECSNLTSITLPNTIASIGDNAFYRCSKLASINLPDGLPNIGNRVFYQCTKLTSITLPESITAIREAAFCQSGLTSIRIPASVVSIGEDAFAGCSLNEVTISDYVIRYFTTIFEDIGVKSVIIIDGSTSISERAFENYTSLTNITIPNSVTSIGAYAFNGCTGLTSIIISSGVTSIGNNAFSNCTNLITIYFNAINCPRIGSDNDPNDNPAFNGCSKLKSVIIGNGVKIIPSYAFCYCSWLINITIPNSVTTIGSSSFRSCSGLSSITIPSSVTNIGTDAFKYCSGLTSIVIPNSVISIGPTAFKYCTGLNDVTLSNGLTYLQGGLFSGCTEITSITIPNGVKIIGERVFEGTGLTSITIPNSVTSIDSLAFEACNSFSNIDVNISNTKYSSQDGVLFDKNKTTIIKYPQGKNNNYIIPNSVTQIGHNAFRGIGNKSITIPNSVTIIEDYAFSYSGLTSITIPNSVSSIGAGTFNGCFDLTTVIVKNNTPPVISNYSLSLSWPSLSAIKVPAESVAAYKTADGWSFYANLIVADE